jgi:regulatory protein
MKPKTNKPQGAGKSGPRRLAALQDLEALIAVAGWITAIEPQKHDPDRRSIFVDGTFVVGLHVETILVAKLRVGNQIDGTRLVTVLKEDEAKKAWDAALIYLGRSARSRLEVTKKLASRFGPDVCSSVVERLSAGGWLDDYEFATTFVRSYPAYGERRLRTSLLRKGINPEVAEQVLREQLVGRDEVAQAREVATKRLERMGEVDRDTAHRRIAGLLARRGYGFDTISQVLGPLLAELPRAPRPSSRMGGFKRQRPRGEEDA